MLTNHKLKGSFNGRFDPGQAQSREFINTSRFRALPYACTPGNRPNKKLMACRSGNALPATRITAIAVLRGTVEGYCSDLTSPFLSCRCRFGAFVVASTRLPLQEPRVVQRRKAVTSRSEHQCFVACGVPRRRQVTLVRFETPFSCIHPPPPSLIPIFIYLTFLFSSFFF